MKEIIVDILTYIKTNLSDELTIEEVAGHFGYSKYHFSREFKRLTGFSAADYLSSIKIERAKQELLKQNFSVTDSSFDAGFSSLGTFSTTFAKKTGLSPREYKKQVESLYGITKEYERKSPCTLHYYSEEKNTEKNNQLSLTIHYPENYESSITFAGLFRSPIPNHKPIVGTALAQTNRHTFTHIPDGDYYLLVCSIEKTMNPLRYFVLNECLRGKVEEVLHFPSSEHSHVEVHLRPPLPEDPPILINLPKLLADSFPFRNL
ncbi:AraC family transcriptional regulator [Robertmurraya siralis]|uniref:AraC family transcriptional regulator n=1 Tax=Robertmurraya siralis TaxID=77777 RepID=A0A919WI23_9BACI|nr:AraC family transcriptional regulator [Robertmurraya siralis]PAE20257.1 AraC family transcriptional regulator [Bacillus sp. 7504-2]GIN62183.1 AraC family transcriptional regulator [Robertmurraya siralis]